MPAFTQQLSGQTLYVKHHICCLPSNCSASLQSLQPMQYLYWLQQEVTSCTHLAAVVLVLYYEAHSSNSSPLVSRVSYAAGLRHSSQVCLSDNLSSLYCARWPLYCQAAAKLLSRPRACC